MFLYFVFMGPVARNVSLRMWIIRVVSPDQIGSPFRMVDKPNTLFNDIWLPQRRPSVDAVL